ncbi:hypothetical protein BJ165DRAFT_1418989 [Panaeolus papilionaceus]|nr:hypothetical protein BJ165DRAFT_1418989 [Panaeolus papilionaceus]
MKSKSSSERLSDVTAEKSGPSEERTEERTEIRASEGPVSLIDRFSDDRSRRVERDERDSRHSRFGEAVGALHSVPPPPHGTRNLDLPPRPQVSPEVLPPQLQRPVNGRVDDTHDGDIRMDTGHEEPPHLHDRNLQGPSSKVSLLERLSLADNIHEPQSLRERIVPSKRDREEMVGRDRSDGRDMQYDMDDGVDPKRQRRRGGGRARRSNTGGGRR